MTQLLLSVGLFLASHLIPAVPALRGRLINTLGWRGYLVAYSLLSLGVLAWVAHAYAGAPYVEVWSYEPALRWVPVLVMPVASVLLVAGLARPNPLSVSLWRGGTRTSEGEGFRGGLFGLIRHPVPWGFGLWAGAHMVPNGDAASLVLFGLLLLLSVGGIHGLDAKRRRQLGEAAWHQLARRRPAVTGRDALGVLGGLGLYILLAVAHEPVIGIAPWPPALMALTFGG